jgi:hypothetical protein
MVPITISTTTNLNQRIHESLGSATSVSGIAEQIGNSRAKALGNPQENPQS